MHSTIFSSSYARLNMRNNKVGQGFTLVELAIVMMIVGLLMGGGLISISQYIKVQRTKETRQKIDQVMNVLSAYIQAHYRLPCPADPGAVAARQGWEIDNGGVAGQPGKCLTPHGNPGTITSNTMYMETEGIVPWKELGIPQNAVVDAWGNYLTYKPAPNLTVDMTNPSMQNLPTLVNGDPNPSYVADNLQDVHNACRTSMWYDDAGNHVNRAKALFCCDAQPTQAYLKENYGAASMPRNWRQNGVIDTYTAQGIPGNTNTMLPPATPVLATSNWSDSISNANADQFYGTFSHPDNGLDQGNHNSTTTAPLLRATGLAVTLISHGGDGNFAFLPEQQKTNRLGGMVEPNGMPSDGQMGERENAGWPQMFAGVIGHPKLNGGTFDLLNSDSNKSDDIVAYLHTDHIFAKVGNGSCVLPPSNSSQPYQCLAQVFNNTGNFEMAMGYGFQLNFASHQQYRLRLSFVNMSGPTAWHDLVGYYEVDKTGNIKNVGLISADTKSLAVGQTINSNAVLSEDTEDFKSLVSVYSWFLAVAAVKMRRKTLRPIIHF